MIELDGAASDFNQHGPIGKGVGAFLWQLSSGYRLHFLFHVFLCLMWSAKEALLPLCVKYIVNGTHQYSLGHVSLWIILWPVLCVFILWAVMEVSMRFQSILRLQSFPKFVAHVRQYCFQRLQCADYARSLSVGASTISSKTVLNVPKACEELLEVFVLHIPSIGGAVLISLFLLAQVGISFLLLGVVWLTCHFGYHIILCVCNQ